MKTDTFDGVTILIAEENKLIVHKNDHNVKVNEISLGISDSIENYEEIDIPTDINNEIKE